jgi:hypothetical protein
VQVVEGRVMATRAKRTYQVKGLVSFRLTGRKRLVEVIKAGLTEREATECRIQHDGTGRYMAAWVAKDGK